ncbi:AAA family ATPase, partial [Pseudomonas sp. MWU12-2323]|nr:AAA family ATPase [Pseudomonas sp. MWU12-2323]
MLRLGRAGGDSPVALAIVGDLDLSGGVNLIEASAGTGKTWTIAALFARLLLEDSDGQPPPTIDRLLVVTYTKAATAELRERLRRRLGEMLA